LNAAIAMQSTWLQIWVLVLVATNLAAILFVISRQEKGFRIRPEAIAILLSFVAATVAMRWLYDKLGYVRLLGLSHLVFWLPVYIWLLAKYRRNEFIAPFKHYLAVYFLITGLSLVMDFSDVVRYLLERTL
jgi:hypothetical protein